ncbi:hypothetical protein DFP74_4350 [Nocardiopsis sp. Huas11]|nr:hypothetical protein DFP74_4350 [Nocardiopsis sp. Huas11]
MPTLTRKDDVKGANPAGSDVAKITLLRVVLRLEHSRTSRKPLEPQE